MYDSALLYFSIAVLVVLLHFCTAVLVELPTTSAAFPFYVYMWVYDASC